MTKLLRKFLLNDRGNALVEFALAMPFLALLTVGATDIGTYVLLHQKLESSAHSVADLAARDDTLSVSQLNDIFASIEHILSPFEVGPRSLAIVSGVGAAVDNVPEVNWQQPGGGTLSATSLVGSTGGPATIAAGLNILAGETVIVAEVLYQFEPLFGVVVEPTTLRRVIYARPRLGSLESLEP